MDLPKILRARRLAAYLASLILLTLSVIGAAAPVLTPGEQKGIAWLASNVKANGSLASENVSIATPLQVREESAVTLATLATAPLPLRGVIAANTDSNNEYIARRIVAASNGGQVAVADVAVLIAQQNADGGWGLDSNYQSDPLDTALVLLALRAANSSAAATMRSALIYLSQATSDDGGWGSNGQSSVYVTANVLLAANAWPASAGTIVDAATNWLLAKRSAASTYGNTFNNAHALLALATQPAQGSVLPALVSAIDSTQASDGSWSDDAYLTALALRARWFATQPSTAPTSGDVQGLVVDQSSNQPLPGASVQLGENASVSAISAADGSFHLTAIPPGSYTLQISATGYQSRTQSIQIVAGQRVKLGVLALVPIATTAILRGIAKSDTGQLLQNVIIAVGDRSTVTDVSGTYQLVGLTPGTANLSASLNGYQTSTAAVTFVAGTSYLFSPTLYPNNVTPPSTSLQGLLIDADSSIPVIGASVVLNSATQTTDAGGHFAFGNLASGAFVLSISADGYQSSSASGTLVTGLNDVGAIKLHTSPTSSTLQGHVLDDAGNAIANATLALDSGPSTLSAADGSYSLSDLVGTHFSLSIAAASYIGQTFVFSVNAPGPVTQDFHLLAQTSNALTLGALTVAPGSAAANINLSVSTTLINGGAAEVDGVLLLEIYDAAGNLVGSGPLTDAGGFGLDVIALAPGAHQSIVGHWNTRQFVPGNYRAEVRLVQLNSITRAAPLGTLLIARQAPFLITATMHFSGSVAGDPPAIQAGLNQTVHLTATMRNDGNVTLPPQTLSLNVIDSTSGTIVFTTTAAIAQQAPNALVIPDFGNWLPAAGGNYRLQAVASEASLGALLGTLYVGNVAQATFTVDPTSVLAGTRNVHGNIHIAGVNPANATITDPLAPLMRVAMQNAVTYNDTAAHTWIDTNRCSSCHIGNQALIGGELTRQLTSYNLFDRTTILNNVSTNQGTDGGLTQGYGYSGYYHRLGSLSLWGLLGYHNLGEFRTVIKHAADWVVGFQRSDGGWSADYNSAWFDNDISMAMLNISNLSHVDTYLKTNAVANVPVYGVQPLLANQPVSSRAFLFASASGNLFYTDASDASVNLVKPDGTPITRWTGFNDPRCVVERGDGQVWLSSSGGTFKLNADGTSSLLAPGNFNSLELGPDGTTVWGVVYGDQTIYQLDGNGVASAWLPNGPFSSMVFVNPDADGSLYVTDRNTGRIYHVLPDKSVTVAVEVVQGAQSEPSLIQLLKDGDHWLLSTSNGIYRFSHDWEGQRIVWSGEVDQMARLADGTVIFVGYAQRGIMKLVLQNEAVTPALSKYESAISLGTSWLQTQNLASSDTLHLAQQLWGLGEAYRFYQISDTTLAASVRAAMMPIATQLRGNQNSDGGWGRSVGNGSDALVTAQVGIALDYTDPSAGDPAIRNAVAWLLSQQQADGSWASANGIMATHESTTTMVAIWLPTILDRLGSIDAKISVTFPSNIQATYGAPTPDQTSTDVDGNVTSTWALTGVTDAGRDLGFDLTLQNMALGESRPVASDAHLVFNNSFSQQAVAMPIAVPNVVAAAPVNLTVVTDQPSYPANAIAQITTTLVNQDSAQIDGVLSVTVNDPDGAQVGAVLQQNVSLPAGANLPVIQPFAIGTILPVQYTVVAVLSNASGRLAKGQTSFSVQPDNAAVSATSTLHTDRAVYNPSDRVQIISHAFSQSVNVVLTQLDLAVSVIDAQSNTLFTQHFGIEQLLPGASRDFTAQQVLANVPPGIYTVKQDLRDSQGGLYNHVETSYRVGSTSNTGFGLTGTIAALPKILRPGETLALNASASNHGNGPLNALPLTIYIVDPDLGTVLTQFTQSSTILAGSSATFNAPWPAQGRVGATYLAILTATLGNGATSNSVTLAQDTFQLIAQTAAGIQATGGTPQGATITQAYPVALEATVSDTVGQPLAGVTVSFVAPMTGASVSFSAGASAITDAQGHARVTVSANASSGAVIVSATAPGVANTALFNLQNLAPVAATIRASAGTPQNTATGTAYAQPLQAFVQDNLGQPMAGIAVTFAAPANGASVSFPAGNVAVTDSNGHASVPVQADTTAGDFSVAASAPNVQGNAAFALSNTATASADIGVTLTGPASMPLRQSLAASARISAPSSSPSAVADAILTYTLSVHNAGPSDAQNVSISAVIPAGLTLSSSSGPCTVFPCSLGTLKVGQIMAFNMSYSIAKTYPANSVVMTIDASSDTTDPDTRNNSASVTTQLTRASALVVPVPLDTRWMLVLLAALLGLGCRAMGRLRP
jgi:uncharacterized repeat protein (TIGR01451 family)